MVPPATSMGPHQGLHEASVQLEGPLQQRQALVLRQDGLTQTRGHQHLRGSRHKSYTEYTSTHKIHVWYICEYLGYIDGECYHILYTNFGSKIFETCFNIDIYYMYTRI